MTQVQTRMSERIRFLRRRFPPHRRLFCGPADAVPLVNLVLLLMMFMIVHSSFVLKPGVTVNLPEAAFASGAGLGATVVTVSQEGMVFFNDERTTLEGLESAFSQAAFEKPDAALVIEADGQVRHSTIVRIYNMAMAAGIRKVVMATRVSPTGEAGP
jgi:biopolymer transport protein ExbD